MAKATLKAWGQVIRVPVKDKDGNKTGETKILNSKRNPDEQAVEVKWSVEVFESAEKGGSSSFPLPIWNKIVENRGMEVTANAPVQNSGSIEFPGRKVSLTENGSGDQLIVTQGPEVKTYFLKKGEAEAIMTASKNRLFINEEREVERV